MVEDLGKPTQRGLSIPPKNILCGFSGMEANSQSPSQILAENFSPGIFIPLFPNRSCRFNGLDFGNSTTFRIFRNLSKEISVQFAPVSDEHFRIWDGMDLVPVASITTHMIYYGHYHVGCRFSTVKISLHFEKNRRLQNRAMLASLYSGQFSGLQTTNKFIIIIRLRHQRKISAWLVLPPQCI